MEPGCFCKDLGFGFGILKGQLQGIGFGGRRIRGGEGYAVKRIGTGFECNIDQLADGFFFQDPNGKVGIGIVGRELFRAIGIVIHGIDVDIVGIDVFLGDVVLDQGCADGSNGLIHLCLCFQHIFVPGIDPERDDCHISGNQRLTRAVYGDLGIC